MFSLLLVALEASLASLWLHCNALGLLLARIGTLFGYPWAGSGPMWAVSVSHGISLGLLGLPRRPLPVGIYFCMCFTSENGPPMPRMRDRRSYLIWFVQKVVFRLDETPS